MSDAELRCADIARALDEPLAGTAAEAVGFVCVEHPGPWTPKAPTRTELGELATHLDVPGVRTQLIRRVRHHGGVDLNPQVTVLLGHAAVQPAERWLLELTLPDTVTARELLLDLDPRVLLAPTRPDLGTPVDHDVWLVCTHARRDACCAVHGRTAALALDLAGVDVWETTHTGGHRFAATAIVLPDGLSLGHLDDTPDLAELAADLAAGHLPVQHLRGRCAAPRPAMAAEVALREHLGTSARDGVLPLAVDDTTVVVDAEGRTWTGTIREDRSSPRPISDDAQPTAPLHWTVTGWRTS